MGGDGPPPARPTEPTPVVADAGSVGPAVPTGSRTEGPDSFFEPTVPRYERPAPPAERSLFDPAGPPARQDPAPGPREEPNEAFPASPAPLEERTEALFASPVPDRAESFSASPAGVQERTEALFMPPAPVQDRTESLFVSPYRAEEPTATPAEPVREARADVPPVADPTPATIHPPAPVPSDFVPANEVEEELLAAAGSGSTDSFLTTLLLARVLLPTAADSAPGSRPGDPGFVWGTEELDGGTYVVVYTSPERLADRVDPPVDTVRVKFVQLIRRWPDEAWSFAVNPGTPVGATYPGEQVLALANWAAEVGLGDEPESEPEETGTATTPAAETRPAPARVDPTRPVTMQKAVAPSQLAYYLERGYDRVSGFVHRAAELAHLSSPAELYDALGLGHAGSPFSREADEIYVLRWPAYRPSLYRIPYGGQNEAAMRAMEGWVIERPPFRGNGFAPGESSDVVAEFKVDSARLPHGAQLWRIGADRTERVVAILDTDALLWRQVGEA
ncbi:SseB protein N-terminal domain-containing protein [Micromonospora auratinigra]|uniref:SseB protein N-terminal domain-containing protein n=1 Tax=Micromonospora auratinigra TaxID=261654 RepID=A0A1A9A357_9ACTN|nr:SseB protein N-terminal domain-containing protein [Micromonospora auratinigra]